MNDGDSSKSAIPEKAPPHYPHRPAAYFLAYHRSNIRLVIFVGMSVFLCETLVMFVVRPFSHLPLWLIALIDAVGLVLILSPLLYVFIFRPMVQNLNERERAEKALRESEMRFRTIFNTSPDAVIVSRLDDGLFMEVNRGFSALSGYAADEVIGKTALDVNIWRDTQDREKMVAELQRKGVALNLEAQFNRKDGSVRTALVSANVITLQGLQHIMAVARDITDLKATQRKLEASHRFLLVANRNTDMDPLLREFTQEIRELMGCAAVGIRILDRDGNIPYHAHEGFGEDFYNAENPLTIGSVPCMCADVILGRTDYQPSFLTQAGTFYLNSTSRFLAAISREERQKTCDICNSYGFESVALVPIRLKDRIIGLIHLADPGENMFPSEAVEIIEGATMQLGPAIERVRIEEALKESHRELEDRVKDRTARLVEANELLILEIQERRQTEKELIANQDKLRMLSAELLLTEERERRHIATELHDRIGQTLAVSKIKLGGLREEAPSPEFAEALNEIRRYIDQTIRDTRSLTFELSPPTLYELGLESALQGLVEQIHENYGLRIEFSDDRRPKPLDTSCRVVAYMAVRELLFNIIKHAAAHSVRLAVERAENTLRIRIADDGVGFDLADVSSRPGSVRGFGLHSIRERMGPLRGQLEIESEPGKGTRVTIVLPLTCQISTKGNQQS